MIESPQLPSRRGYDAVGVVDAIGEGIMNVSVGDRVSTFPAFSQGQYGVYGEWAIVTAHAVIAYPENLSPEEAATIGVQYMTGYFALFEHGKLKAGDYILITGIRLHAATYTQYPHNRRRFGSTLDSCTGKSANSTHAVRTLA